MTIGFTYDLRSDYLKEGYSEEETAEFDRESTIEGITEALQSLGYNVDPIGHIRHLTQRLARGDRWEMVFNICEGMHGIGREAQVPALLDAFGIPYTFSDPLVLSLTLHKGMTKRVVRDHGIATPAFVVIENADECAAMDLAYPLFVKPNAEGTGKGIDPFSKITNPEALFNVCRDLLFRYPCGLLVEEYLPGREFTAGVLGTGGEAFSAGVMEILYKTEDAHEIYSYQTKSEYLTAVRYTIPEQEMVAKCEALALKAWRALGCRDGGRVDIRVDRFGEPNFIEVNPLAGLDKVHSDLPILSYLNGHSFEFLIKSIMDSAVKRTRVS
jgi:D-alanine-D-alanine ligase